MTDTGDEKRHPPTAAALWAESWYFDFALTGASLGGYVRITLCPNLGVAWCWTAVAGRGRALVMLRDHEVGLPRGRALELRAEGLWCEAVCETPLEHWSLGMEAFGVGLDDPAEAWREERGDRTALGLDLEWEAIGGPYTYPGEATRYGQACEVHGEVLLGSERLPVDGAGERDHSWGPLDWWTSPWFWAAGRLGRDGGRDGDGVPDGPGTSAEPFHVLRTGEERPDRADGVSGLPVGAEFGLSSGALTVSPVAHAPICVPAPGGGRSLLARALCHYSHSDGRSGTGWAEWNLPPPA